jgi:DNA polymerase
MRLRPIPRTRLPGFTLCDFESRSRAKLKVVGGRAYWRDPSTEALCAVLYNVDTRRWYLWVPGDPIPRLETAVAHNASNFDRFGGDRCGWDVRAWADSASAARRAGLPGALDILGTRWLGTAKDKVGSRFTIALSTPSRAKATKGELPPITPEALDRVVRYCVADVRIMVRAWERLAPWLEVDADACDVDRVINDRGITLDAELVRALQRAIKRQQDKAVAIAAKAMGFPVDFARKCAMSPQQFTRFTGIPNAQAATVKDALKAGGMRPGAAELCKARLALASVVPGKLAAALARVCPDGRLRDQLAYQGAHTGRWSSRGMQIHNLPRVGFEDEAKRLNAAFAVALAEGRHHERR